MSDKSALSVDRDDRLAEVLDAYLAAHEGGTPPDIDEFLARYPDLAGDLRECVASLAFIRRAGNQSAAGDTSAAGEAVGGVLGDFRILREVGKGGMGVVYEAEQISLRRRVALKVLPFAATMDPRHLQRFRNEAQAAACLHHTNIVPVHFVGCERGVHFYAMQFIDGQPLSEVIRQLREMETKAPSAGEEDAAADQPSGVVGASTRPTAEVTPLTHEGRRSRDYYRKVAELGIQAAEALDHAHQVGIVHRDIKPGNLMLDGRGDLWVTDFGLAHIQQSEVSLTMTCDLVGTLRYMSPEQALTKRFLIDHHTDIYSLGVTLYELLALQPAFAGKDRQELLQQVAFEEATAPRRVNKAIPVELEIILLKAMEKNPTERYATAKELADDLRRFLLHEPIRAKRATIVQRLRKWTQRHQSAVVAAAFIFGLVMIGLLIGTYLLWKKEEQTRDALEQVEKQRNLALANEKRAKALRRRAEVNVDRAFNDMRGLLKELDKKEFAEMAGIDRVRQRLTAYVLDHYESYLDEQSPDPEVRHWAARAYQAVGLLQKDPRKGLEALMKSVTITEALTKEFASDVRYWQRLGFHRYALADYLAAQGQKLEATEEYRLAMDAFEKVVQLAPDNASALNNLAWHLATSDDPTLRDPSRAVVLARRAVELTPDSSLFWDTLGVACYHAGNWGEAISALERALALMAERGVTAISNFSRPSDTENNAKSRFYLTMAHSRLGNVQKARTWYDNVVQWMDGNATQDAQLRRLRNEAADLLGIRKQPSVQNKEAPPRSK